LLIRAGYNIAFECTAPTPLLLMVHIRPERRADLVEPETFTLYPEIPYRIYTDSFAVEPIADPGQRIARADAHRRDSARG